MNLFTRSNVVKKQAVEVSFPRLVENKTIPIREGVPRSAPIECKSEGEDEPDPEQRVAKEQAAFLDQAKAEAAEILAAARGEAEKIRARAESEAEEWQQKVRKEVTAQAQAEGYEKGLNQGRTEGYAAGQDQGEKEAGAKIKQAEGWLQRIQHAAEAEFNRTDDDLLHLSVKIAERIIRAHLANTPELLFHQIEALTLFPQEREGWRLHVSTEDYLWLEEQDIETELRLELIEDESLQPGDSFLECGEGIFDARLDIQLEHLEQRLKEELCHDELEQAGR